MKRERPPMPPLSARVKVAERQLAEWPLKSALRMYEQLIRDQRCLSGRLDWILHTIFGRMNDDLSVFVLPFALDHDPALILREYDPTKSRVADRYTPHAHDPNHLIYREKTDHDRKTFGRTPGAERTVTTKGSDVWLKSKFARLEGRTKQRPKQKIRSRGFQKRVK